jgi:hypothetical protein
MEECEKDWQADGYIVINIGNQLIMKELVEEGRQREKSK